VPPWLAALRRSWGEIIAFSNPPFGRPSASAHGFPPCHSRRPRVFRRPHNFARAFDVNTSIRLIANLPIDAGAVGHRFATCECRRQLIDVVKTTLDDRVFPSACTPRDSNDFMSFAG